MHESPLKIVTRWIIIIVAVTVLLTGWWFWRNYQLYGEWFATETHLNLAGRANIPWLKPGTCATRPNEPTGHLWLGPDSPARMGLSSTILV